MEHKPDKYTSKDELIALYYKTKTCDVRIHLHDSYEIFMALSENIRYFINGNAYDLSKGDLIITNDKEIHRPTVIDDGEYERKFIQFHPHVFTPLITDYNPIRIFDIRPLGMGNHIQVPFESKIGIERLVDEIVDLSQNRNDKNKLKMKALSLQLLILLDEVHYNDLEKTDALTSIDPRVRKVLMDIDKNYTLPFTLDALCDRHYMDKYYLSHLFKKSTGFTILEYIQSKRIQQAKSSILLGVGVMEASRDAGFEDYSNFFKTFRKLVGMSPNAYKKYQHPPVN